MMGWACGYNGNKKCIWKFDSKCTLVRLRHWEDNIKMDLEEDRLCGWKLDAASTDLCPMVGSISSVTTVLDCLVI
jgi:hypothetical protein